MRKRLVKQITELQKELKEEEEKINIEIEHKRAIIDETIGNKYFCGIILNKQSIQEILKMILDGNEHVRIKYQIYVEEE